MRREIKFRLVLDGKIVGIERHEYNKENNHITIFHNEYNIEAVEGAEVHHNHKDQYIGLKDKNEVEIYSGDICRWVDTEGRVYVKEVNWDNDQLCWKFGVIRYCQLNESGYYQTKMEVIGNIHQNPELLKK